MKERIIGAIVLVVFAILVVPIFLDGPPSSEEMVSESVVLPGQSEQKMQTQVLERDRDTPVPAPRTALQPEDTQAAEPEDTRAAEPEETPVAAVATPRVEPEPEKESTATTREVRAESPPDEKPEADPAPQAETSTTGMWAVQLGAFSELERAEKLAAELRKLQFAAFVSKVNTAAGEMHRVRTAPQASREAAEAMATKLSAAGHAGKVVPHP